MKRAVVCGAGGFIASYLVKRLKEERYWVRGNGWIEQQVARAGQ